jgi:hypothetical protein
LGLCGGITSWVRGKREAVAFAEACAQIFRRRNNSTSSGLILNLAKQAPSYCPIDLALFPIGADFAIPSFLAERLRMTRINTAQRRTARA